MDVVAFVDDLFRPRAPRRDALGVDRGDDRRSSAGWDHKVDCTASEVERAFDATHSAVALRSAATAGDNDSRMDSQETQEVLSGMCIETPPPFERALRVRLLMGHGNTNLVVATGPRRRCVSKASSTHPRTTSENASPSVPSSSVFGL